MLEAPPQAPFQEDVSAPAPMHNLPHVLLGLRTQNLVVPGGQVSFHDLSRVSSQCSVCAVSASTVAKPETGPVEASALGALEAPKAGTEILVSVVLALSLVGLPVREQMESAPSVALAWCMPGLERRHSSVA
jgi:hypothetical protein